MKAHWPTDTETVSTQKKAPRVYLGTLLRGACGKSNTRTGDPNEMDLLKVFFYQVIVKGDPLDYIGTIDPRGYKKIMDLDRLSDEELKDLVLK